MTDLIPCSHCRFCVHETEAEGRCHKAEPVMLRGSDRATWPKVQLDAPGCGKGRRPDDAPLESGT